MRTDIYYASILLVFLAGFFSCDRENLDELVEEIPTVIEPEVTDYALDHVYFHDNDYVGSDLATASECELYDPFTGDYLNNYYLINNLQGIEHDAYQDWEEGHFYLFYDFEDDYFHHANIMVEIADTLTLACPIEMTIDIEIEDEDVLAGSFSGEFFVFTNNGQGLESIGLLSGNFHLPMVPCE